MKRFRFAGQGEMDSINIAGVLMLLSRGGSGGGKENPDVRPAQSSSAGRVFECKTCNRQFPSFQALGGHRASHKKPRLIGDGGSQGQGGVAKQRVHECSVCGLEFAIGQALGGHMRRHRTESTEKKKVWLDLNLPPAENDMEYRKVGFGIEIADKIPMVDCFH